MHRHMDLYVRPGTRARDFAGFSRWRVSMLLKMEMKVCHWVNGALFFVLLTFSSYWFRLTVPLCSVSTDALAPDTNRYLFARVFHLAPHPTPPHPPLLPSFVFVFILVSFLLLFVLHFQGNDPPLWLEKTLEFFTCRNHGPMRKRWKYKKYCIWNFRWAHPFHFPLLYYFFQCEFCPIGLFA